MENDLAVITFMSRLLGPRFGSDSDSSSPSSDVGGDAAPALPAAAFKGESFYFSESGVEPAPSSTKLDVSWTAQMANCSEDSVLKTVNSILDKSTPEKFDLLKVKAQLVDAGCITNTNILKGVVSLIFEKAVLEPTFCPMYARLCSDLYKLLSLFPSDEPGGKGSTFRRIVLNGCQQAFEQSYKVKEEIRQTTSPKLESACSPKERSNDKLLHSLGSIRLIVELAKQNMVTEKFVHHIIKIVDHIIQELLGSDVNSLPSEENMEALCQFFTTVGELLDQTKKSSQISDVYFNRLKELTANYLLAPRLRLMVQDVIDLRSNNWNPTQLKVKASTSFQYPKSSTARDCSGQCTSCGRIYANEAVEEIIRNRDAYQLQNQTMAETVQTLTTTIQKLQHLLDGRNDEWARRLQHEKRDAELRLEKEQSRRARKLERITEGLQQLLLETQVLELDESDKEE